MRTLKTLTSIPLFIFTSFLTLAANAQEINDWMNVQITANLENDKVKSYLDNADYTYSSTTVVNQYTGTSVKADESPRPVVVPLPETAASPLAISYYIKDMGGSNRTEVIAEGSTEITLQNLYPGYTYHYTVTALANGNGHSTGDIITQGTIKTEGRVRMIAFPTLHNCRDLGGWPVSYGRRVRYGMIYRGVELHAGRQNTASAADIAEMKRLGINAELDLRRKYSNTNTDFKDIEPPTVSAFGEDVPYLCASFNDYDTMLQGQPTKFHNALQFIIDQLLDGRIIYEHCVWGADRTGMISAMIEALVGVELKDIYMDYEMTSFSPFSGNRNKAVLNKRLIDVVGYSENGTRSLQECMIDYVTTKLNISHEDIIALQDILLEEIPENQEPNTPTAIRQHNSADCNATTVATYTLAGIKTNTLTPGIAIVRRADGTTRKVVR